MATAPTMLGGPSRRSASSCRPRSRSGAAILGRLFTTTDGHTLYVLAELRFNPLGTKRHTGPNLGLTDCTGDCTKTWLPYVAPADAAGAEDWSVVARDDGTRQWAL